VGRDCAPLHLRHQGRPGHLVGHSVCPVRPRGQRSGVHQSLRRVLPLGNGKFVARPLVLRQP
jgi:hypothetical protein